MASWRVLTLGPGTMKDTEYFVAGCQVLIQKVPYRKPKKYPTSTKAQEGVPPSHATNISSEEMQLDPPTPVSKVTESVRKMRIDMRRGPVKTWKPKRHVEDVKVSTNTVPLSGDSVPLAPKIPHAGKEAPKADLPAYGRGKAAALAQAKGKVDAPGTTDRAAVSVQAREKKEAEERAAVREHNMKAAERMKAAASAQAKPAASAQAKGKGDAPGTSYAQAAASAQARERKEAEEKAAVLEHNKKAAERMKAAVPTQAMPAVSAQGRKAAASAQAKRKAGEESGTLSAVEGRGNVAHRVEESSEDDSEATQDDSDE